MPGKRVRMRPWALAVLAVVGAAALWVTTVTAQVLFPPRAPVPSSDAVVALSPASARLPAALELMDDGVAEVLVISAFAPDEEETKDTAALIKELCSTAEPFRSECVRPNPVSTIGEALAVRELVRARGWTAVTVVTHSDHVFRAGFIFRSCLGSDVTVALHPIDRQRTADRWLRRIAYENAAFIKAIGDVQTLCR